MREIAVDQKTRGLTNYLNGLSAEECVERLYCDKGAELAARRWRGKSGEVDLIFREGATLVFVEVKKSKDFATAAERLTARQIGRISRAAEEFAGTTSLGLMSPIRIDVALVNDRGESQILENVTL